MHKLIRWVLLYGFRIANHFRITHGKDLIPKLPPAWMGFKHSGDEVFTVHLIHCSIGITKHQHHIKYALIQKRISVLIVLLNLIQMIITIIWEV